MTEWHDRPVTYPGMTGGRAPEHLRGTDGGITAADEVAELRRAAALEWVTRHGLDVDVNDLLVRAAVVGDDVAASEARAGTLPASDATR